MNAERPDEGSLSPRARTLLDSARRQGGPSGLQRAAVTAAVVSSTSGAAAAAGSAAAGVSLSKLIGAGVIATIVGASGAAGVMTLRRPSSPPLPIKEQLSPVRAAPSPPVARPVPVPVPETPPSAPIKTADEPVVTPAPRRADTPAAPSTPPASEPERVETPDIAAPAPSPHHELAPDTSAEEVTALGAALEALEENRPADALEIARRTRRSVPHGVLRPELMVIEIEALCALRRVDEAKAVEASMTSAERSGLAAEKLRRSCTQTR